jgi:hypothetical protein
MAEQTRQGRRRSVARLGVPGLLVAVLALVALWRIGPSVPGKSDAVGTAGHDAGGVLGPLTRLSDVLTANAVGRHASLENIPVREVTSASTFWAGEPGGDPVFIVLDPTVRRPPGGLEPGERLTLIGTVAPAPDPAEAARAWGVDQTIARAVTDRGVYLRATEVIPRGKP